MTRSIAIATILATTGVAGVAGIAATPEPALARQAAVQAQPHQDHHPNAAQQEGLQAEANRMMEMHQQMMAGMTAMDERLNALVATMNSATGDAKVDATAELLSTMVEQRTAMRTGMMEMQSRMMGHMMQHMAGAMSPEMQSMIAACPMMKMMEGGR